MYEAEAMSEDYAIKIVEDRDNKLIGRRELIVLIDHFGKGTIPRRELRRRIAQMLSVNEDLVYVRKIETEYGLMISKARVHIYESVERALEIEPEHIIRKNRGGEEGGSRT